MSDNNSIPPWIDEKLFADVLRDTVGDFKKIESFKVFNALKPGENFATVMLKVQIGVILDDDTSVTQTFMLKVAHDSELNRDHLSQWNMFVKEAGMYGDILPEMEQLYRDKGLHIRFVPKSYKLPVKEEYILLEDLGSKGFRNVKRQDCLDMIHSKSVLKKLAQWHAASAVRITQKGLYPQVYLDGYLTPTAEAKEVCEHIFGNCFRYTAKSAQKLPNNEEYIEKVESVYGRLVDIIFDAFKVDTNEFNVLNHGDCWCNNVMFQYDAQGELAETHFVDLQAPRYGSPAQDLWYFILSSPTLLLKIDHFDELVHYYHDNLIEHLKILEYKKTLPSLKDLHKMLLQQGAWAALTVGSVMAGVLCDSSDDSSIDNFVGEAAGESSFLNRLFFNERYVAHIAKLLPWLYNKGVFDY